MESLHRESARNLRYRRPVAVLVVAVEPVSGDRGALGWLGRVAGPVAHSIQRGLRSTDLVTRAADARFYVLMPETSVREARRVGERIVADCDVWLRAMDAPIGVRVAAAGATHDLTLEAALDRAIATAEGR